MMHKHGVNKSKRITAVVLAAGMVAGSSMLGGCGKNYASPSNAKEALVVTLGDNKLYMNEIKPYIFFEEFSGQTSNYYYKMLGISDSYWSDTSYDDDSKTNSEAAKEKALNDAIEDYILYYEGEKTGDYELSDDEKSALESNAKALIECMSDKSIKKTGFTEDDFVKYQTVVHISDEYKQALIESFGVTTDQFKENYDFDNEYRGYEVSYARIPLTTTQDDGTSVDKTEDEKAAANDALEQLRAKIESGTGFQEASLDFADQGVETDTYTFTVGDYKALIAKDEKEAKEAEAENTSEVKDADTENTADAGKTEDSETKDDESKDEDSEAADDDATAEPSSEATSNENLIKTMYNYNVGALTEVFEADGYYYVARLESNTSTSVYDSKLESDKTEEENKQYDEWLEKQKEGDYKCTVNDDVWKEIDVEQLTLIEDEYLKAFGILEDPAKKNK